MKREDANKVAGLSARDLPPALRVYWETAPENFRIPSLLAAITCLSSLATRVRVKYVYDQEPHALLLQVIIVGKPGDGKSFTRPIYKTLMGQLKLRDNEMRRQEQAYSELKQKSNNNAKLPDAPITDVRCLQNVTRVKLVKRADYFVRKYGEPLTFMLFSEELATITEGNKKAYSDLRTIGRLAYDLGAEFSNDTNSDQSYNATVDIIWCSLFCSTSAALNKYMDKESIEGGNVTRHVVADLGNLMGSKAPVFKPQTPEQERLLRDTVTQLMNATYAEDGALMPIHNVDMSWMDKEVDRWCDTQRDTVLRTGSNSVDCFYKRASVSAFRMATLCYYLWGEKPEVQKSVKKFYRYMAWYTFNGLMARWGKKYEAMHKDDMLDTENHTPSLYDSLPHQFSKDQLREQIIKLELTSPARIFINRWKQRKWIYQPDKDQEIYVKNY